MRVVVSGLGALLLLAVVALCLLGACDRAPQTWGGIDRWRASCSRRSDDPQRATCVFEARLYECIRDRGSDAWQCAPAPRAESP